MESYTWNLHNFINQCPKFKKAIEKILVELASAMRKVHEAAAQCNLGREKH